MSAGHITIKGRTFYRLQTRAQAAEDRAADDFIIAAGRLVKVG